MLDHGGGEDQAVKHTAKDIWLVEISVQLQLCNKGVEFTLSAQPTKSIVEHEQYK